MIYNSQDMETTKVSINGWIKKLWHIYTMEYYSAITKKMKLHHLQQHGWTRKPKQTNKQVHGYGEKKIGGCQRQGMWVGGISELFFFFFFFLGLNTTK